LCPKKLRETVNVNVYRLRERLSALPTTNERERERQFERAKIAKLLADKQREISTTKTTTLKQLNSC